MALPALPLLGPPELLLAPPELLLAPPELSGIPFVGVTTGVPVTGTVVVGGVPVTGTVVVGVTQHVVAAGEKVIAKSAATFKPVSNTAAVTRHT